MHLRVEISNPMYRWPPVRSLEYHQWWSFSCFLGGLTCNPTNVNPKPRRFSRVELRTSAAVFDLLTFLPPSMILLASLHRVGPELESVFHLIETGQFASSDMISWLISSCCRQQTGICSPNCLFEEFTLVRKVESLTVMIRCRLLWRFHLPTFPSFGQDCLRHRYISKEERSFAKSKPILRVSGSSSASLTSCRCMLPTWSCCKQWKCWWSR